MNKGEVMTKELREKISNSCKGKRIGMLNPSWKGGMIKVKCLECNAELFRHPSIIKEKVFCSKKCMGISRKNDPNFALWNRGLVRSEEHKTKISLSRIGKITGEKHFAWIKNREEVSNRFKESLSSVEYKKWRQGVFLRDSFKCRMTNNDCNEKIESHHILNWKDYSELRYDINNGITLCGNHHPKGRKKEGEMSLYFQELILQTQK